MNGAAEETDLIGLEGQDGEKRISYFDTLGGDLSKKTFTYVCIIAGQFSKDADRTEYSGKTDPDPSISTLIHHLNH